MNPDTTARGPAASISPRAHRVFLGVVAAATAVVVLRPLLGPSLAAVLVAVVGIPAHRRMERLLPGRRHAAALASLSLCGLCIGIPVAALGVLLLAQVREVVVEILGMPDGMSFASRILQLTEQYLHWLQEISVSAFGSTVDLEAISRSGLHRAGVAVYGALPTLLEGIARLGIALLVFNVVLFFLLRDGERVVSLAAELSPIGERSTRQLLHRIQETLRAVVFGGVVTGLMQGLVGAVGFRLAGFPNFAIWGALILVASFVPLFGTGLIWVPAVVYLVAVGQTGPALLLSAFGLLISSADNLVRVFLIGRRSTLHPLLLFLGVFGGLATSGPIGVLYGLLLVTVLSESVAIVRTGPTAADDPPLRDGGDPAPAS